MKAHSLITAKIIELSYDNHLVFLDSLVFVAYLDESLFLRGLVFVFAHDVHYAPAR
jgi:hypothetical protein